MSESLDGAGGQSGRDDRPGGAWGGYGIGAVFLLLAAWFVWGPSGIDLPEKDLVAIDPDRLTTEPRRIILRDPPMVNIDGFDRTCMSCHQLFPPREDPPKALAQHGHVVLNHGINERCRNCHDAQDRNLLVLRGGEKITYDEVEVLCGKCHGPTYRDWQRGAHGRTNGYWDSARGEVRRLDCTECHDPHNPRVPAMDPLVALPGPDTLRMGRAGAHAAETEAEQNAGKRDPLRRAIQEYAAMDATEAAAESGDPPAEELFEGGDSE